MAAAMETRMTMTTTKKKFKTWSLAVMIPRNLLVLTDWNINEMTERAFAELVSEIKDHDFDEPCQVVPIKEGPDEGKYLVIGGEHRYKAACALEMDDVPCVIKDSLNPSDRAGLMEYSVRRNNIRGRIIAERLANLESELMSKRAISVEAVRNKLFLKGELLKGLRKTAAIRDNEDDEAEKGGRETRKKREEGEADPDPIGTKAIKKAVSLGASLGALRAEVLDRHGDTVENGYIYFGQGDKQHLIVEESKSLYTLVARMVSAAKSESASIDEFLVSAIQRELKEWER